MPGLVILVGTAQIDAQGVSLAAIVITAAVALTVHLRQGTVHRGVATWAVAPAVGLSVLGAYVAAQLEGDALQRILWRHALASIDANAGVGCAALEGAALGRPAPNAAGRRARPAAA